MRAMQREDFTVGTTGNKFLQHFPAVVRRITHLAVQLAIGKSSSPPLAELRIGFWLKLRSPSPESEGVSTALLHRLTALQKQGPKAHLSQKKGREITARTSSDYNRAKRSIRRAGGGRSLCDVVIVLIRTAANSTIGSTPPEQRLLSTHSHIHAVDETNPITTPRIDAAFHQMAFKQMIQRNLETTKNGPIQILLGVIKLQTDLAQPQHKSDLPQMVPFENLPTGNQAGDGLPGG